MYQKERLDNILDYIQKYGYVTTKSLVDNFHYSVASVNRDLNVLERQGYVKRTYGGVEFIERRIAPYKFRHHKMKEEKRRIAKKAVDLIEEGDTVFIAAGTTTEYMIDYLLTKKKIHVITNSMYIAFRLSEMKIATTCLGGKILEDPYYLGGNDTVETAAKYGADKFFFATSAFTADGRIGCGMSWYNMYVTMENNSDKTVYLATSDKVANKSDIRLYLHDFSKVDCVISDFEFSEETKSLYPNTEFIKV